MKKLACLVVADPSDAAATQIVTETARLADKRIVAHSGEEALTRILDEKPEMLLLSLEIQHPDAAAVVVRLRKSSAQLFIVATFRELGVPAMNKLAKIGVDDFVPQPIDYTALYRAASQRFGMGFRRHTRYPTTLEIYRADGVLVGNTVDISEGGLLMRCIHPAQKDASMLFDISLAGSEERRIRVRCHVIDVLGEAPQKVTARMQFQNLRGEEHRRLMAFLAELSQTMPDLDV